MFTDKDMSQLIDLWDIVRNVIFQVFLYNALLHLNFIGIQHTCMSILI